MNKILSYCAAATALLTIPAAANATTTLFDQTDFSATNLPVNLIFTAGAATTTLDFSGYQVPDWMGLDDIYLVLTGDSPTTNLLALNFDETGGPPCSNGWQSVAPGTYGTNSLRFGNACEGAYYTFSQTVGTTVGSSYTLGFQLWNPDPGDNNREDIVPSGLRITATDAIVAGVPEPSTWAMMLLGFGGIGMAMRFRRRRQQVATA
jgi:hypothetical protein